MTGGQQIGPALAFENIPSRNRLLCLAGFYVLKITAGGSD